MAGPSPVNSACNCCLQPTDNVSIQYVLIYQSCSVPNCGIPPCASTDITSTNITCIPNFSDLTRSEKCSTRYLTIQEEIHSEEEIVLGRLVQYTLNESGVPCSVDFGTQSPAGVNVIRYTNKIDPLPCAPEEFPSFPEFWEDFFAWDGKCNNDGDIIFPEYEEGQGGFIAGGADPIPSQTAYKYTHPNNPQIKSEQRIRYRFEHAPTASCYLKVWFRKKIQQWKFEDCDTGFAGDPPRTEPPLYTINCGDFSGAGSGGCFSRWSTDGEPSYEDDGTHEWEGSGYPCFEEIAKPPNNCDNTIKGEEVKNLVAGENQSITIEFKYSIIKDYEPNWPDENGSQGCKPNRVPIPNPEDCPEYNP